MDKFEIDIPKGGGCYTADPVESCFGCNFSDLSGKGFDLDKICQCPPDMTWPEYGRLKEQYSETGKPQTKKEFWKFVRENYLLKV